MPATDQFSHNNAGLTSPAEHAFTITPHDTNELSFVTREIYVGTGGDISAVMVSGDIITLANVPDGARLPYRIRKINATGTSATDMVGVY